MLSSIQRTDRSVREYVENVDPSGTESANREPSRGDMVANQPNEEVVDNAAPIKSRSRSTTTVSRRKGAGRLIALDAARGLAVLGMYLQHFGSNLTISSIVAGNTTLLFVLCGGISYSIMAQRMMERGSEPVAFRARMIARAVFVDIIGYLLIMLNTPYGIILPAYAALFVLALLLVRRSTRTIVTTAVLLLFFAPPLMLFGMSIFKGAYLLSDIAGGPISALALAPAFVAGMAIGRIDLTRIQTGVLLTISGIVMLVVGKLLGAFVLPGWSARWEQWLLSVINYNATPPDEYAIWPFNTEIPLWHTLFLTAPHTATTFQTLIGLGMAFVVLGIACLVAQKFAAILIPFAAVGRVALTMYALQFVIVWIFSVLKIDYNMPGLPLHDLIIVLLGLLIGWLFSRMPSGPLENMMRRFDTLFSSAKPVTTPVK
ncbi:DUF418 domain-containing protein [Paenibacillus bovis]|uniref:DUF418 domain-containing protein n=1 Tax=Paenibacillus bovis TaxID=1616788 RepID=UPI001D132329|nr:DUF418 domain-containing protein [Paenibacillus bovis]